MGCPFSIKNVPSCGGSGPHLIHGSLGPPGFHNPISILIRSAIFEGQTDPQTLKEIQTSTERWRVEVPVRDTQTDRQANFKMYLLRQFCWNQVQSFFTIHRRHRRKKCWTRILKFGLCDFWEFFWNFQKGVARSLCGRSGPLWSRPN